MTVDERIEAAIVALENGVRFLEDQRAYPSAEFVELRAAVKVQREILDELFKYVSDAKKAACEVGGSWSGEPLDKCIRRIAEEGP